MRVRDARCYQTRCYFSQENTARILKDHNCQQGLTLFLGRLKTKSLKVLNADSFVNHISYQRVMIGRQTNARTIPATITSTTLTPRS